MSVLRFARCMLFASAVVLPHAAATHGSVADPGDPTPRVGTNLEAVNDWGTMLPFNDLFKTSRPWISGNAATFQWDDGRALDLDADGWVRSLKPNQIARTIMLVDDVTSHVGAGRYVVLYDGSGTIQYAGSTTLVSHAAGRDVIDVQANGSGLFLYIVATSPTNWIRNIRVLPEAVSGAASPPLFAQAFLSRLEPYGVLRFMDWARTNETTLSQWSARPEPSDARWSGENGVPLETMVDLANETCSEPWFCIPHLASDDYVRRAAQLIHARLAPGLRVWVEHSNETWNGAFAQAAYVQQRGLALGLSTDAWQAGWFWHSRRSVQIFRIFAEVFGDARPLQRVMGGFVTVPWGNEQALAFEDADLETDVLAIAPYFGHEWGSERVAEARQMTPTQLVQALRTQSLPPVLALVGENRALAKSHGVGLVAYEGGHHLAAPQLSWNDPVHAVFHGAARSAAMGTLYADYLDGWDAAGGGAFVNFSLCGGFTQWGCWSVLEWITQPATPRESALIAHAAGQWLPSCSACAGDVNGDGVVGASDLSEVLFRWGPATGAIAADLNDDGIVDAADISLVLTHWGACGG